jgi:subtilisin family serine protease
MPILKVFAEPTAAASIAKKAAIIATYNAFLIVDAGGTKASALAREYPVEDVTDQYQLHIGGRRINTLKPAPAAAVLRGAKRAARETRLGAGPHHYIVQFIGPIKAGWLARLRALGAKPRAPFGGYSYVVWAKAETLAKISALDFVLWTGHLPHRDRLAPGLVTGTAPTPLPRRRARHGVFTLSAFVSTDVGRIVRAARVIGFKVLSADRAARVIVVSSDEDTATQRKQLQALSAVHGVSAIRQRVLPRTANNVAVTIMGNGYASESASGLRLTGKGEIVAVCDTGLDTGVAATIHPDLSGRVVAIKSYPITPDYNKYIYNPGANDGAADLDSGHGTHTSGSVLGSGAASSTGDVVIRGHAPKAKLIFQAVEQEMKWKPNAPSELSEDRYILAGIPNNLSALFQFAYSNGARVHSNSWGGGDAGAYDDQCRQFDEFAWKHKDLCFVISAGNDGTDKDGDGKINLMSVTSPGTAKNCITVGACENRRPEFKSEKYGDWWPKDFPVGPQKGDAMANDPDQVVAFSSRGPTEDNRIKPDVIAPGTFILSTRSTMLAKNNFAWGAYPPNKKYFHMGGTSMATPLTAGAAALIREFLRNERGIANPTAALVKAVLIAGAQRLPGTAPAGTIADNHQGFGRVNLDRSVKTPLVTLEGSKLSTGNKNSFTFSVPSAGRTLRLVLAYTDAPGARLVNNLNLVVTDPFGKRFVGNQGSASGVLTLDTTNNVEVMQVTSARKGTWNVDVIASNVPHGPQDFAVAAVLA